MRTKRVLAAAAVGVCAAIMAPAALATAETAQETIKRLKSEGYTVTIDRVGTGPLDECVVTDIRNPKETMQWVPYVGPGTPDESVLVATTTSKAISVSLDCSG